MVSACDLRNQGLPCNTCHLFLIYNHSVLGFRWQLKSGVFVKLLGDSLKAAELHKHTLLYKTVISSQFHSTAMCGKITFAVFIFTSFCLCIYMEGLQNHQISAANVTLGYSGWRTNVLVLQKENLETNPFGLDKITATTSQILTLTNSPLL